MLMEIPNVIFMSGGRAGSTDQDGDFPGFEAISEDASTTSKGTNMHSYDWATMMSSWHDGAGAMIVPLLGFVGPGEIDTGNSGNMHRVDMGILPFGDPHTGSDHDSTLNFANFTEFNIKKEQPFGQPSVYAAAKSDMRSNDQAGSVRPWEVTSDSKVNSPWGTGSVTLGNANDGVAISKGMPYYHRFGDWQDYPNFWNPYWRAKLESFNSLTELMEAYVASTDTNAMQDWAVVSAICGVQAGIGGVEGAGGDKPPFNLKSCL
jgi:hypothetical protein